MLSKTQRRDFRRKLLLWYSNHGRDLPWRRTNDPYAILVSEVMLQQTQVTTVVPFYERWLKRFPNFTALAAASESEVLHAWQGLGYYSRARNLHSAAKLIVRQYNGDLPPDPEQIYRLPGIGRYTAHAVATFAFNKPLPIVEANITRVLARVFNITTAVDSAIGRERLWQTAESIVPERNPAKFNSALMDLGALICTRNPLCHVCPVKSFCQAPKPEALPIKRARAQTVQLTESHAFVRRGDSLLLEKCSGRWRGMWMLPPILVDTRAKRPIHSSIFPFTHHRVNLQVFRTTATKTKRNRTWFSVDQLENTPIPSPHRRAIEALLPVGR